MPVMVAILVKTACFLSMSLFSLANVLFIVLSLTSSISRISLFSSLGFSGYWLAASGIYSLVFILTATENILGLRNSLIEFWLTGFGGLVFLVLPYCQPITKKPLPIRTLTRTNRGSFTLSAKTI